MDTDAGRDGTSKPPRRCERYPDWRALLAAVKIPRPEVIRTMPQALAARQLGTANRTLLFAQDISHRQHWDAYERGDDETVEATNGAAFNELADPLYRKLNRAQTAFCGRAAPEHLQSFRRHAHVGGGMLASTRVALDAPGLRAPRARTRARTCSGGGRPRASASRSCARSDDSGDSGSSEGDGEPAAARPLLYLAHPRHGRVNAAMARALRRLGA